MRVQQRRRNLNLMCLGYDTVSSLGLCRLVVSCDKKFYSTAFFHSSVNGQLGKPLGKPNKWQEVPAIAGWTGIPLTQQRDQLIHATQTGAIIKRLYR